MTLKIDADLSGSAARVFRYSPNELPSESQAVRKALMNYLARLSAAREGDGKVPTAIRTETTSSAAESSEE